MAAAALAPQQPLRCELCNASFVTDAQLQQHLDGPVHKKAVEADAKERARIAHLSQHGARAQDALEAARWAGGGGRTTTTSKQRPAAAENTTGGGSGDHPPAAANSHRASQPQRQRQQQQQPGRGRPLPGGGGASIRREEQLTHAQVLAAAKQDSAPLSLDGAWWSA